MIRLTARVWPAFLAGRLAYVIAITLLAVVVLVPAGPVRAANPNPTQPPAAPTPVPTANPGQQKKATPTPGPVVTPTPVVTSAPVQTPAPVVTVAPIVTSAPVLTLAPGASLVPVATATQRATPTPRPASGGAVATSNPPGISASTPPTAAGASSPESTDGPVGMGSISSRGSGKGDGPPAAVFLLLAVFGVLAILGGWFIAGRRSARDEEPVAAGAVSDPGRRSAMDLPVKSQPTIALGEARFHDPLLAAIERSRDPRSSLHSTHGTVPAAVADSSSTLNGPTWVGRLDPRIRVSPAPKVGPGGTRDPKAEAPSARSSGA